MSYILEALQKAEAERKLGEVPGLLAQPAAILPSPSLPGATRRRTPALIAIALLAGAAALAWFWQARAPLPQAPLPVSAPAPASTPASMPPPVLAQAAPPMPPAPHIVAVGPAPAPAPEIRPAPKPRPAPQRTAAPRPKPQSASAQTPATQASVAPDRQVPASVPAANPPPAPAGADLRVTTALAPEPGTASPQELPEQIRRELPALAIGGYLYSENPRERQLLVNKRLLREGEEAAPGVTLEKMLPKAAIFSYKGYRYRIAY